jgi:hypothetical protein
MSTMTVSLGSRERRECPKTTPIISEYHDMSMNLRGSIHDRKTPWEHPTVPEHHRVFALGGGAGLGRNQARVF